MHKKLLRGLQFLACGALVALICGVATPAAADDSSTLGNIEGSNNNAYLTKVLSLKDGVNVRQAKNNGSDEYDADSYEFTFAGGGTIGSDMKSGDVLQSGPLVAGNRVPVLGDENGKVTLSAAVVNISDNGTHQNGSDASTFIYVIRQSLKDIVTAEGVTFDRPGVYTYRVTETGVNKVVSGNEVGITRSNASYLMLVTVKYNETTNKNVPTNIDVVKEKDDEGNTTGNDVYPQTNGKVDPAYPKVSPGDSGDSTLIDATSPPSEFIGMDDLAPDSRGRNVYGFTFANEYVIGVDFNLKKEVAGDFGDRTKPFEVSVTFEDPAAPDNCRYVYRIVTYNSDGTWTEGSRQGALFTNHKATITALLKHNEYIKVIGVQGYNKMGQNITNDNSDTTTPSQFDPAYTDRDWLGNGVVPNTAYTVKENAVEHYRAKITTFDEGSGDSPQTITSSTTGHNAYVARTAAVNALAETSGLTTGSAPKTVIVLNTYDDASTNPTGIIIDNLPYVLMIGIPVAVFAVMFVSRRRNNDAAA